MSQNLPPLTLDDLPVRVGEIEIDRVFAGFGHSGGSTAAPEARSDAADSTDDHARYRSVRLLVRLHGQPLGYVTFPPGHVDDAVVAATIWSQLGSEIADHLEADGLERPSGLGPEGLPLPADVARPTCLDGAADRPLISVVVCTRDRPEGAVAAVRGLLALTYEPFEVVLVDNAPSDDATYDAISREFGSDARVRYVREPKPGLSRARNRGVAEAKGEIVAFTDDDVQVDRLWLDGIRRGFRRAENVGCVTGLVPSAQLENAVQLYFDQRVSWGSSCRPRIFDLKDHRDESFLYPYSAGIFGTGANFAFDRRLLQQTGPFDEALGAGAPCGGGEDLDIFVRTLRAGWTIVYEPSAIINHVHRAEISELHKQMFNYGAGFSAFAAKYVLNPRTAPAIVARLPRGLVKLRGVARRAGDGAILPQAIVAREFKGMAWGPWLYLKSKWWVRKTR